MLNALTEANMCMADGHFHPVTNSQLATSKIAPICIKQANCSVSRSLRKTFRNLPKCSGFSEQLSNLDVLPEIWIATRLSWPCWQMCDSPRPTDLVIGQMVTFHVTLSVWPVQTHGSRYVSAAGFIVLWIYCKPRESKNDFFILLHQFEKYIIH